MPRHIVEAPNPSPLASSIQVPRLEPRFHGLNSLSVELNIIIFMGLTTLDDVWALACTSSRFWETFHSNSVRILDMVLKDDTYPAIRTVMLAVFNIRAGTMKPLTYRQLRHIEKLDGSALQELKIPTEHARDLVTTARKIHAAAHVILENCMTRLWSLEGKFRPNDINKTEPSLKEYIDREANLGDETRAILGLWLCELHTTLVEEAKKAQKDDPTWVKRTLGDDRNPSAPISRSITDFYRRSWAGTMWTLYYGLKNMHLPAHKQRNEFAAEPEPPKKIEIPKLPAGSLKKGLYCRLTQRNYDRNSDRGEYDWKATTDDVMRRPLVMDYLTRGRAICPRDSALHRLPLCEFIELGLLHWDHDKTGDGLGLLPRRGVTVEQMAKYWETLLSVDVIKIHAALQQEEKRTYLAHMDATGGPASEYGGSDDDDYYDPFETEIRSDFEE